MSIVSKHELLRRVPFFSMLPEAALQSISAVIVKQRFRRGHLLVKQGELCSGFYIIVSGSAQVISSDTRGREVILATLKPGDYFGEMSIIDDEVASAGIRFDAQADVLVITDEEFKRYLPPAGSVADGIMRGLVRRLRAADQKIQSLALLDVYERVENALYELAQEQDNVLIISGKTSRQDIAKMVGASREMVSRVMRELEKNEFYKLNENNDMVLTNTPHTNL